MTIISWSGGKDSTATVILAHKLGIRIDKIIMSEVMFDKEKGISNELPEHIQFVYEVAIPQFSAWGFETEILHDTEDYKSLFYHINLKGKNVGKVRGFPLGGKCILNSYCKMRPIRQFRKNNDIECEYVGVCIDEPLRLARLKGNVRSLLAENNMTQQDAFNLCTEYGLLSPIYFKGRRRRSGCWNCPNQSYDSFADLKMYHPEKWAALKEMSRTSNLASPRFKWSEPFDIVERKVDDIIRRRKSRLIFKEGISK